MKINCREKSSVAWFKLAEYVGRGERERALTLYRLLTHSLVDQAFIKKLEADLWLSFDAKEAEQYYRNAAHLYKKAQKFEEAFQIYQLIFNYYNPQIQDLEHCIELAITLGFTEKEYFFSYRLTHLLIDHGLFDDARRLFLKYQDHITINQHLHFYTTFIPKALQSSYHEPNNIQEFLDTTITLFKNNRDHDALQDFLHHVETIKSSRI